MDTSELISDADILPSAPSAAKPAGKGAPELLSNMSGLYSIQPQQALKSPCFHVCDSSQMRGYKLDSAAVWPCLIVLQAFAVEMSFVSLHARSVASWSVALTSLITMFVSARPEFQGAQSAQAQVQGAAKIRLIPRLQQTLQVWQ